MYTLHTSSDPRCDKICIQHVGSQVTLHTRPYTESATTLPTIPPSCSASSCCLPAVLPATPPARVHPSAVPHPGTAVSPHYTVC
ncbi:hypothetical protein CgunFtcFv8_017405 [Champsocephalus gunnari]|uniref:Uncharacterized protein n=1 Tax=Champsocephalus gunnari TaxID=52237 RepID=A0AAN8DRV3_CHAGU|nr:hypothetical protein CgunFtcFv8_017405 [Champsocephalus gunnari]